MITQFDTLPSSRQDEITQSRETLHSIVSNEAFVVKSTYTPDGIVLVIDPSKLMLSVGRALKILIIDSDIAPCNLPKNVSEVVDDWAWDDGLAIEEMGFLIGVILFD